ncbi:MAG: pantoate--beta-alanine ligase [Gammaproteobacteria bacterium]|nr:MAG: pantoate--beta-alanine ligase [Pseudomonadota bacterium]PIE37923.1 MAG: pantoate--beta-alanine ligase [Gammaproteobacteria bacterium]
MKIANDVQTVREQITEARNEGKTIGFVPTMGNLHEGHLALIHHAREKADYVVCSIFVNPMQFGQNEDLDSYPRTLDDDIAKLEEAGTDLLFTPDNKMIYPNGLDRHTRVSVPAITELHCGFSRPGHFEGVSTVVTILFNLVQPDIAVFGEKDYQQLAVIRTMTKDLHLPIQIIGHPTVREPDGLAKSSRNGYLNREERAKAPRLYQVMQACIKKIADGNSQFDSLKQEACQQLKDEGFDIDYFNLANSDTLEMATPSDQYVTLLAAARLGSTRLIDNLSIDRAATI